jgi:hypothetical protein
MDTFDLSPTHLRNQVDQAWDYVWKRFYLPSTNLIYDYITSYEEGHYLDKLPTPEEIKRQHPNPCGWGTGMEDSSINGGAMLSLVCDRFAVTGEKEMYAAAQKIYSGLYDCATIHGMPGFVARSLCPADGKSAYNNSSRDQFTHFVHGFWKLWTSPLADPKMKRGIEDCLAAVARFVEKSVTPENQYRLLMLNGTPAPEVCAMWDLNNIDPHEAARLPMFYAAAFAVTGESHFQKQCMKYYKPAAEASCQLWTMPYSSYPLLQMACSLELLLTVFPQYDECNALCRRALSDAAERAQFNTLLAARHFLSLPKEQPVFQDWRQCPTHKSRVAGYIVPKHENFSNQAAREAGEAALAHLSHFRPLLRLKRHNKLFRSPPLALNKRVAQASPAGDGSTTTFRTGSALTSMPRAL